METDVRQVKEWLERLPGGAAVGEYTERWNGFNSTSKPVVTIFGSYDTGKSSLIRRILVDGGVPVPEWLTISGRHETFDINQVAWAGCILRDSPGLAVGADDVRGKSNTALACEAISTTDVAIITVTPQLATGERDMLMQIIDGGWTAEGLWLVISRFDEAGIDPDDDLEGYRQLAHRKIEELRDSLEVSADFPVHVVSQDFAQIAGASRDVAPDIWDDSRAWDGMDALAHDLACVGERDFAAIRGATEERYWRQIGRTEIAKLRLQLAESEALLAQANDVMARQQQSLTALDAIDSAARADLHGTVRQSVRTAFAGGSRDAAIADLQSTLGSWYKKHNRSLDRLLQDVKKSAQRQQSQPLWRQLEEMMSAFRDGADPARSTQVQGIATYVSRIGSPLVEALRKSGSIRPVGTGRSSRKVAVTGRSWSLEQGAEVAAAVLPIAVEIARMIDDRRARRESEAREREAVQAQEDLTREATDRALGIWTELVSEIRNDISEIEGTHSVVLPEELRDCVEQLRAAIVEGDRILG